MGERQERCVKKEKERRVIMHESENGEEEGRVKAKRGRGEEGGK